MPEGSKRKLERNGFMHLRAQSKHLPKICIGSYVSKCKYCSTNICFQAAFIFRAFLYENYTIIKYISKIVSPKSLFLAADYTQMQDSYLHRTSADEMNLTLLV